VEREGASATAAGVLDAARGPIEPGAGVDALETAREAQQAWAGRSVRARLGVIRKLRRAIAARAEDFVAAVGRRGPEGAVETLGAEVLPLADACRFLEKRASRVLRPRRLRGGAPLWLGRVALELRRDPLGVVLIVAPSNYPLLLSGVQAVQALAAGNAVLVKPAPGCAAPMRVLAGLLETAGLDPRLFQVLPEASELAQKIVQNLAAAGIDKVLLTGSAPTGRAVLADLAPRLTPAVMELSGCDAVFVLEDADVELASRALAFGLVFNASATCIAPRRVFVHRAICEEIEAGLVREAAALPPPWVEPSRAARARTLVEEALAGGGRLAVGTLDEDPRCWPLVVAGAGLESRLLREDVFAPVLTLLPFADEPEALRASAACPYALGAAVFGTQARARSFAAEVRAGVVVVNDLMAPTADPRLPFGGRGQSGFGVTRGAEGLLELTALKAVAVRRGKWRPHLEGTRPGDDRLFLEYLRAAHGASLWGRIGALLRLCGGLVRRGRNREAR
jgi:acyl-CoA reductase-like NAD-dependent aldehyde dehydrogenase